MKKLTGYIGAMIIVFALMGSILLGYALNINGSTVIMNEYDGVTDVSGLYSYSDEKSYIDYNPASNYIGYGVENVAYNSDIGDYRFKSTTSNTTITIDSTNGNLTVAGNTYTPASNDFPLIICDKLCVMFYSGHINIRGNYEYSFYSETLTITVNNGNIDLKSNGSPVINTTITKLLYYCGNSDEFDYYYIPGKGYGNNTTYTTYINDINEIYTYSIVSPRIGNTNVSLTVPMVTRGNNYWSVNRDLGTYVSGTFTPGFLTNITDIGNNVYSINPNYDTYYTYELGDPQYNRTVNGYYIFYPRQALTSGSGIDYTESNRVNNYPTSQYSENRTTTTNQFNLSDMTGILTDYAPADEQRSGRTAIIGRTPDFTPPGNSLMTNITWSWPNSYKVYNFLLADIINSQSIPATTYQIKITFDSNSYSTFSGLLSSAQMNKNFDINTACLNYNEWYVDTVANYNTANNKIIEINDCYGEKEYVMYDPATGIIDIYNYNDVKIATRSAYNTYVTCFVYDNGALGSWDGLFYYSTFYSTYYKNQYIQTNPMISSGGNTNLVTATYYQMSSTPATYMDVTKGVKINSSNVSDTIWNNEYENGDVQIVFRSESIGNNYTNQIQTMPGDIITVDYTDSKYYVAINSEEAVEIGNWRNIVLDLNFNHDTVSVYPVKTFNSYVDVIVYDTPIYIGKITHTDNTQLKWLPTANSLMFSIYKTSVFMDTYGVVMVDPSLDITNYFTDLNQFYRLKIYNFSIYGEGMTINGITGTVTGNKITFNDETVTLKEMYVTYSDGHVYVQDSNASIDLGEIISTNISMVGAWYFNSFLEKGYTTQKTIYEWDWSSFVVDNTEFCIFYIGLALAGLIIARKFCSLSIIDYVIFITSIVLALSIQVIA